ncbi:hypothetical protein AB0D49_17410 [Streptomyces sp. NPDC048290]
MTRHRRANRSLRTWKFTSDGPFWGGVLMVTVCVSVLGYVAAVVTLHSR